MRAAYSGIGRGLENPVVMGHRFCVRCGRWRQLVDFGYTGRAPFGVAGYCRRCGRVDRRSCGGWLNPKPLRHSMERYSVEQFADHGSFSWTLFAEWCGVSDKRLRCLLNGETDYVRLETADRIACAMGMPLSLLYPGMAA